MLERRDAIMNEVLEPITFVLAYPLYTKWTFIYDMYVFNTPQS